MDIDKVNEAILNIEKEEKAYLQAFLSMYLFIDSEKYLDELYEFFSNSGANLFSDEIVNNANYISKAKEKCFQDILDGISYYLGKDLELDVQTLLSELKENKLVENINLQSYKNINKLSFQLGEKAYLLCFEKNNLELIEEYEETYDTELLELENYLIIKIFKDSLIKGYLEIENDLSNYTKYKYGFIKNSQYICLEETNEKQIKELIKVYKKFSMDFRKLKLSKSFNLKEVIKRYCEKYDSKSIEYFLINEIINSLIGLKRLDKEKIEAKSNEKRISFVEFRILLSKLENNIHDFYLELKRNNIEKESYETKFNRAKNKLIENS